MLCNLCPRKCNIDRNINQGYCTEKSNARIANYGLFNFEEPCISYKNGSGAIFFSGCSLKCVYCQNYEISQNGTGQEITDEELANIFKELDKTADNINLVNPTHFSSNIINALKIYKPKCPVVYNTHGYEKVEIIEELASYVDIFLTDLKYFSEEKSFKYSKAKNYFEVTSKAINKMCELKKDVFENGKMLYGVIIRHLLLPGNLEDSKLCLDWVKENQPNRLISLMAQYVPMGKANLYPEINRKVTNNEYNSLLEYADSLSLNGFSQELTSADKDFIPKFSNNVIKKRR